MTDALNRFFAALLGAVLIAAGVLGILLHNAVFHIQPPSGMFADVKDSFGDNVGWASVIVFAALLVLFILGLALLKRELGRVNRSHAAPLTHSSDLGRTRLEPSVLEHALNWQSERIAGVANCKVKMLSSGARPRTWIRLDLHPDASLEKIRTGIDKACTEVASQLGVNAIRTTVDLHVRSESTPRVE